MVMPLLSVLTTASLRGTSGHSFYKQLLLPKTDIVDLQITNIQHDRKACQKASLQEWLQGMLRVNA